MSETCLFCRIASGEISSRKAFSNERIFAFHDINPQAPVHVLIVPKKHISSLAASSDEDAALLGEIQAVARALAQELKLEGFRLILNNGRIAGQSVDHLHYHLLGGRRFAWPPG